MSRHEAARHLPTPLPDSCLLPSLHHPVDLRPSSILNRINGNRRLSFASGTFLGCSEVQKVPDFTKMPQYNRQKNNPIGLNAPMPLIRIASNYVRTRFSFGQLDALGLALRILLLSPVVSERGERLLPVKYFPLLMQLLRSFLLRSLAL